MSKKTPPSIGEQIRAAREEQGISGYRLAQVAGVSRVQVHKIEHGGGCSAASLQILATALGVPIVVHPAQPILTGAVPLLTRQKKTATGEGRG